MKRLWKTGLIAGAGILIAALFATGIVSMRIGGDHAQAAGSPASSASTAAPPSLVAIAIGQLVEPSRESFTVDLHRD